MPKISNPKDVIIRVTHSGVCGTDLSIIAGRFPAAAKLIQGHEFSGIVHEIGGAVKHLKVGDRYSNGACLIWICIGRLAFQDLNPFKCQLYNPMVKHSQFVGVCRQITWVGMTIL